MASEFAQQLLSKIDQGEGMLTTLETMEYEDLIDAELSEVREVLDGLRMGELTDGGCWCIESPSRTQQSGWKHTTCCKRASVLYQRLNSGELK